MFRRLAMSLAAAVALIAQLALPASATLGVGGFAVRDSLAESSPVENAQFVWGGRNYCWYASAWRGPGWYQCGFAWRRGFGWGGGAGWHGWNHRPVHRTHVVHHHHRPVHRPGHHNRPNHNRPVHSRPGHNRPNHSRPPAHRPGGNNRGGGGNRGGGHNRTGGGQRRS
jgi:hypothetical protein